MAERHDEFLELGARVFALSADTVAQNTAVVEKLALPFPILSDPDRTRAITPLGFADDDDPRQISKPGTMIIAPGGEVVFSVTGRDYADRPDEDILLDHLRGLGLPATTQAAPELGEAQAGETAMAYEGLSFYFRGAKFAGLALRGRHRDLGEDFRDDAKAYVRMVERYMEALPYVEQRRA
jgi:hypothetical protein